VIGVLADLHDDGISQPAPTAVYWPLTQKFGSGPLRVSRNVDYLIRSRRSGSAAFTQELRQALAAVNPNLPLANVRTLDSIYRRSLARTSLALLLIGIAGALAMALGLVGIYGSIAYSVSLRTRDIGIRMALGSTARDVVQLFVRQGLTVSGIGAFCGLLASFAVTRLLRSLLFGVSTIDPATYGAVVCCLIVAASLASWLPAQRAATVNPIDALRAE
jgi:ABC-type antimicrobial peptide transport system permease subunit